MREAIPADPTVARSVMKSRNAATLCSADCSVSRRSDLPIMALLTGALGGGPP